MPPSTQTFDVIVVGSGPAGSTAARILTAGGAKVALVDRATFPRVKLCGGWLSTPIWDVLGIASSEYTGRLWPWQTCHVSYQGETHAISCRGWFIRRYELDDFLRARSGATFITEQVKPADIVRDGGSWTIGDVSARYLVGAGGTHCPVARILAPQRPHTVVGAQENEFQADPSAIARSRIGKDGEPELLLHDDLRGYSWNVSKTDWVNIGCGTADPTLVRAYWQLAREHFRDHVPAQAQPELDAVKGHSYYLFDPAHVAGAARDNAFLVGDSLGLAHPLTAEGILPAILSGRLAAESILTGADYIARMHGHPILADYARVVRLRDTIGSMLGPSDARPALSGSSKQAANSSATKRLGRRAVASVFAWMFSGARLPAPRIIDLALAGAERWRGGRSA